MIRTIAIFTGNVQGVGFRYTTRSIAQQFAVTGSVRNLSNGSVEMIAEGTRTEIAAFVEAIKERMTGHINGVDVEESEATAEFRGFEILQ